MSFFKRKKKTDEEATAKSGANNARRKRVVVVTDDLRIVDFDKKNPVPGTKFDSKDEAQFFLLLLDKLKSGEIKELRLQPKFVLIDNFVYRVTGKKINGIEYVPDFEIMYPDESLEYIDVKGFAGDPQFKLKHKLFMSRYPDVKLTLWTHVKKYGGWILVEEYERIKKEEAKAKQVAAKLAENF